MSLLVPALATTTSGTPSPLRSPNPGVRAVRRNAAEGVVNGRLESAVAIAQQHGERTAGRIVCHDIELAVGVEVGQDQVAGEGPCGRTEAGGSAQVAFAIAQQNDNT